jgi:undecaprenyl pyrophosphate phosphatase UppP
MIIRKTFFVLTLAVAMHLILSKDALAYLDPGTGSYIFQVLIASFIVALVAIKTFWQNIKNFFRSHFSKKQ